MRTVHRTKESSTYLQTTHYSEFSIYLPCFCHNSLRSWTLLHHDAFYLVRRIHVVIDACVTPKYPTTAAAVPFFSAWYAYRVVDVRLWNIFSISVLYDSPDLNFSFP